MIMSISKKNKMNNKKNKSARKNYKLESLEPRFLMDAASDDSYKQWTDELAYVNAPTLWTDINALKADSTVNEIIDGLYKKNENTGSLDRAQISDLLEYDYYAHAGMDVKETSQKMLEKIQDDLSAKMKKISKDSVITASKLSGAIGGGQTLSLNSSQYFKDVITYKVSSVKKDSITIDATVEISVREDNGILSWLNEYRTNQKIAEYAEDFFCADMADTTIGIEADFDFRSYNKRLEFSFVLDGKASNGVDQKSTLYTEMTFNESGDARYGVLDLVGDSDKGADLLIANRWTVSESKKINETGFSADLSFSVKDAKEDFSGDIVNKKFKYTKSLSFNPEDKGSWSNSNIEKYATFSMGRVMGKLQEVSSRLTAFQNGEYYDDEVDFDDLLSKNALTLLNLSAMLDDVINEPPESLQELVERMNKSPYRAVEKSEIKINVSGDSITIPFKLVYAEYEDENTKFKDRKTYIDSEVALSKEKLERLLCVEVLENKTVKVQSTATLSFDLIIPFKKTEMADADSKLYELGLDNTNDQLGAVIGANALVAANAMEHFYWGGKDLTEYTDKILKISGMPSGVSACLNSKDTSYALYYDLTSSAATLNFSEGNKFDPTGLAEFNGAVASKCVVFKWTDNYTSIQYKNVDTKSKVRKIDASKSTKIESAASILNSLFAQSTEDCAKGLKAVAFNDCIVILLGAKKADSADAEKKVNDAIIAELKNVIFINDAEKETALQNLALKEIWISDELSPAHYDEKAVMTVTVGNVSYDLEFAEGYFNSATCVADIAAGLQEMINAKFHWNVVDETGKISYEPAHLFVDASDGRIRFVSLQDYAIDFHDKTFAEWLGFKSSALVIDEMQEEHALIATSSAEVEKMRQNLREADVKVRVKSLDALSLKITVDGKEKSISVKKNEFEKALWASDVARILQEKINKAFGWNDDSALLNVTCHNDKICLRSPENFSVSTKDESMLISLGFMKASVQGNQDGTRTYTVSNIREYHSTKLTDTDIQAIKDYTSDIEFTIAFDEDHKYVVKCDASDFADVGKDPDENMLWRVAYTLNGLVQEACTDYTLPMVSVHEDIQNGTICFSSESNFSLSFATESSAKLFGFGETKKDGTNGFAVQGLYVQEDFEDNVRHECMEIVVDFGNDNKKNYKIDVGSIIGEYQKKGAKECTVGTLLEKIVAALNKKIGHDYFVVNGVKIEFNSSEYKDLEVDPLILNIKDINGYTLASLLGLVGEYGKDTAEQRENFSVIASLVDDYIKEDSKVPLFKNFNLTVNNKITQGRVEIPVNYGVFGETVHMDMTGMACRTEVRNATDKGKYKFRIRDLNKPAYTYDLWSDSANRDNWWRVVLNEGINGNRQAGNLSFWSDTSTFVATFNTPGDNAILNTATGAFRGSNYTKGDLYSDLYESACLNWMNQFFGENATGLSNVQLPILGKTLLEIMGLQSKLSELESLLTKDMSCSTIQELVADITNKTGIKTVATLEQDRVRLDFEWKTSVTNKLLELDNLYFGLDNFGLSGLFKTFLNANLTFRAQVNLIDQGTGKVRAVPSKAKIVGDVNLQSRNISADLDINVLEKGANGKDVLKQAQLQVESESGKESNIFLRAKIGDDQKIQMNLGGELYTYRYGALAGIAKLCVAQWDGYANASSWNGVQNSDIGRFVCDKVSPKAVAILKDAASAVIHAGDILLDFTGIKDLDLKQTGLFDKLRQSVDGLSDTVRRLQSSLNSTLMNEDIRNIPLLGDNIINVGDSLTFLNDRFIEPFRKYIYSKTSGLNAGVVTEKLYNILSAFIPSSAEGGLEICSDSKTVEWAQKTFNRYYKGIQFYESDDAVYWHLRLHTVYTLEKGADFDLGYSGLGLKAESGVDVELELVLDFGFGFSLKDGAFLLLSNGHESANNLDQERSKVEKETAADTHAGDDLRLIVRVKPKANLKGSLGFLTMTASLAQKDIVLNLGLDMNDGGGFKENALKDWENDKNAKSVIRFNELKSSISTEANLRGDMQLDLNMLLGIGGYGKKAPHIETALHFGWGSEFGDGFGSLRQVKFDDIVFDCGSFVKNTVGGIVDKVDRLIKPLRPLIKFLQAEIPVLNKLPAGGFHMTVLDLIKKFGDQKGMDFGFLDDIIEMDNVVKKLKNLLDKGIRIDGWTIFEKLSAKFSEKSAGELLDSPEALKAKAYSVGMDFLKGKISDAEKFVDEKLDQLMVNGPEWVATSIGESIESGEIGLAKVPDYAKELLESEKAALEPVVMKDWHQVNVQLPEFGGSWEFPIFEDPKSEIMKILMGGHADLVVFDMRPLKFNFDWRKSFPIIGPLCADVGFSFGVDIDLCFGYDTCGVENWAKSHFKNFSALLDGFFVADWDLKTNEDVAEVVFHSGVVAGASLCGRFGVNVGLNLNVNLDFRDPNNDGKIRLTEMAELIAKPLDAFDVSASISARAFAYLDVVFYRKEWTLWSSGAFDLFNTASKPGDNLATRSGEDLIINVGEFAKDNSVKELSEDGNDNVKLEIDGKNVKVALTNEQGNSRNATYEMKENNLCVYAGEGDDKITISSDDPAEFNIFVYAGNGDDTIDLSGLSVAEGYFVVVVGSAGTDRITGASAGTNYLFGDEGLWAFTPETKNEKKKVFDQVFSYPTEAGDADIIVGGTSEKAKPTNYIFGGAGNDFIVGGSGENVIFGDFGRLKNENGKLVADRYDTFDEGGSDLVYGGQNNDRIYGGAGFDLVHASGGDDEIHGGQGNDVLLGGSGDDAIYGGEGTDVIFGDVPFKSDMTIALSSDSLEKGAQLPFTFLAHELKGMVDSLGNYVSPFFSALEENGVKVDTVKMFDFVDEYIDRTFDKGSKWTKEILEDLVVVENAPTNGSDVIDGGNGADVIFGDDGKNAADVGKESFAGGRDVIKGGAGNDFIDGDAGSDTIDGGSGMDIIYGGRGSDTIDGGSGNDFLFGDDGWVEYAKETSQKGQWFNKNGVISNGKSVFGDIADATGKVFGISNEAKSKAGGGDDTIIAGNDSDFVDGQSGNDTYKVQFMGGSSEVITNVMDSGDDADDSMKVFGTLDVDNLVIRDSDAGLGLVALLPDGADKKSLERVNYWKTSGRKDSGVDSVYVETKSGADTVAVDSVLTPTTVDTGDDNDTVNIGQIYNSARSASAGLNALDAFNNSIIKTADGKYMSVGPDLSVTVKGGVGDDTVNVLHTDASVSLFGNLGDDTFNVYSILDENQKAIKNNGKITVVGGSTSTSFGNGSTESENGTLNIYGLPYASTYLLGEHNVVSANMDVSFAALRQLKLYGSEASDSIFSKSIAQIAVEVVDPGKNDEFYFSNPPNGYGRFPSDATEDDVRMLIESEQTQNSIRVMVVDKDGNDISGRPFVAEDGEVVRYGIKLSKQPTSDVTIKVNVLDLSEKDVLRHEAGFTLFDKNGKEVKSLELTFTKKNYDTVQYVSIKALEDYVFERDSVACIQQSVIESSKQDVVDGMNVLVYEHSSSNQATPYNGFTDTLKFKVEDCSYDKKAKAYSIKVKLNPDYHSHEFYGNLPEKLVVSCDGVASKNIKTSVVGNELQVTISGKNLDPNANININYITDRWYLDDECSVQVKYWAADKRDFQCPKIGLIINNNGRTLTNVRDASSEGYFYRVDGNRIIICSNETGEPVNVTGTLVLPNEALGMYITSETYSKYHTGGDDYATYFRKTSTLSDAELPSALTLPGEKNTAATPAPAAAPAAALTGFDSETELVDGLPDTISVGAGETVRIKIGASNVASASSVSLMVNSEDGNSLPALTWSWDDSSKKRRSVEEDVDLSYQVNLSDVASEDDFIYVYLHAAKACQFVASAFVG